MAVIEHLGKGVQLPDDTLFSVRGNGRKWSSALAARSAASPARICFVGDSVTEGLDSSYVERFKRRIIPLNNMNMTPGWVHASQDIAWALNPYSFTLTTGTANSPAGQNVEDVHSLSTSGWKLASGSVMSLRDYTNTLLSSTYGPIFDTIEFHYTVFGTSGAAGSLTVAIDAVNQTAINTVDTSIGAGNYEIRTVTYTVTRGQHAVTVTGSGGQPSIFGGLYLSDGDTVWVYQVGDAGDEFIDMNMTGGGRPIQGMAAIDADCVMWMHGINNFHAGDLAAAVTAATDAETAFVNTKAAVSDVSIGYAPPYPAQTRATWPLFVTEWRRVCAKNDVPVCDLSTMLVTNASTTDPFDLIDNGGSIANTHPNLSGAEYMADQLARFVGLVGINWWSLVDQAAYRASLRTLGQAATQALPGDALQGGYNAVFTNYAFSAGVVITKTDTGKAYLLLRDQKGTATTGTSFEIGFNGYGATQQLGVGGVNGLAWLRGIAPSTWTDTSAPLDFAFGNCASGSTTVTERMRLLAGGWLQFSEFAAPAGTTNKPAIGSRLSGANDQFGVLMPDSTVRVLASSGSGDLEALPADAAMRPTGIYAETIDRFNVNVANQAVLTSGTLYMVSIGLKTGQKVTNISFWSATTGAGTPTHWLFSLHDTATRALLATSADQTTTAWGANTKKTLAMTSAYTVPTANNYYLALFVVATTVPTLRGIAVDATLAADPPIMNGNSSSTGLTTAAPNPAGAITAGAIRVWAGVS